MKKKNMVIYSLIILSLGIVIGIISNNLKTTKSINNGADIEVLNDAEHEKLVSGYFFKTTKKDVIEKEFDGDYLNSFVTVAEPHEKFSINVKGIDEGRDVYIIDPTTGNMTPMEYKDGIFSVSTSLDKEINYGIIMDYKLVGSIRVVDDLDKIDEDKLFRDILVGLGCAL